MSYSIITDIFCDKCANWTHGITTYKQAIKKARRVAKSKDWKTFIEDGKIIDMCPDCIEKRSRQSKG